MRDTIDMKVASRFWKTLTAGIAKDYCKPKKIRVDGRVTVVFWQDGTTTVVRCGEDDNPNEYNAFCAALGKRIFGSNSALKRAVEQTEKDVIIFGKKSYDMDHLSGNLKFTSSTTTVSHD